MADTHKQEIRDINLQLIKLTTEQGNLRAKLELLDKAQTLFVDQIQWMRGFCEGSRNQYDQLTRDMLFRDEIEAENERRQRGVRLP